MENLELKVFNTKSRQKEVFRTIEPNKISFYTCGPTVWNLVHVGNLRSALVADLFFRFWKRMGYSVHYVRNYTDVDDKIIEQAKLENVSSEELSKRYIQEVEDDFRKAGIEEPSEKPKVTEFIPEIIETIEQVLKSGAAYEVNGNVIFKVDGFQTYGELSGKKLDELKAGARAEVKEGKENPLDFYLWKASKEGEPAWESPWGKGRPGWHIECSSMILKLFGPQIDVHHGGVDLIFPHHENERAQSESATSCCPFVRYWMHHAFLKVNSQKMSKSLGNVFLARDFLKQFGGELARYLMLSPHYRSSIDFTEKAVESAASGLERLYEAKEMAEELLSNESLSIRKVASFQKTAESTQREILLAFADDFHTPQVMARFFDFIRSFNKTIHGLETKEEKKYCAQVFIDVLNSELVEVLGVGGRPSKEALHDLRSKRRKLFSEAATEEKISNLEVEQMLEERKEARIKKDFKRADAIRDELSQKGVVIKDTPEGQKWYFQ